MLKRPVADILQLYLNEAGQNPLLKQNEIVKLFRQFEKGKNAQDVLDAEIEGKYCLHDGQKATLAKVIEVAHLARQTVYKSNLKLVVSIVKRCHIPPNLDFLDLVEEGNVALSRAIEKFEWRRGNRFSTFASYIIKQRIRNYPLGEQANSIRIPYRELLIISKHQCAKADLLGRLGRLPTSEEIALHINIDVEKLDAVSGISINISSLFSNVWGEEEFHSRRAAPVEHTSLDNLYLKEVLSKAILKLTVQEQEVVNARFGLEDGVCRKIKEVAEKLGRSKTMIQKILTRVLEKLQRNKQIRRLE